MAQDDTPEFVRFHKEGDVGIITLDREPQNRVNRQVAAELGHAVSAAAQSGARALIVRAEGDNFCWGGDFREWPQFSDYLKRRERWTLSNGALIALENLPIPTISVVHGNAFGFGFELALHTDMIIAGESAQFRFPEATIAVFPLAGGAQRIAERAGRNAAARLVMLTEIIDAAEAYRLNLLTKVLPDAELQSGAMEIAVKLASGPTRAHAATKMMLTAWASGGVPNADAQMIELIPNILATDDVETAIKSAAEALAKGGERPTLKFKGT
ncbi:enoyl-CoA hydratase/isomerase family protein [Ruegeria jejuensis]|uniref:enoyl-CoA hydratase/isomerase family protein n=1 Tax=Ruegeria jejuensis TaxID=3233338 RepID=UPI00355C5E8C